jgi:hypothetical protein
LKVPSWKRFNSYSNDLFRNLLVGNLSWPVRLVAVGTLVFIFYQLSMNAFERSLPGRFDLWTTGDWLINYSGGFVRRGLLGTLLIFLSKILTVPPERLVFFIQILFFSVIYYLPLHLFIFDKHLRFRDLMILLSPAALTFPWVDQQGSGRKDIVLLALAAILILGKIKTIRYRYLAVLCFFIVAVHEGLFFFLPLFLICLAAARKDLDRSFKKLLWTLLPAACLFTFIAFQRLPSDSIIKDLTQAISGTEADCWNADAIKALQDTRGAALSQSSNAFGDFIRDQGWKGLLNSAAFLLLAIFPLLLHACWSRGAAGFLSKITPKLLILALVFQLPLFIFAIDWGRWIYIDIMLLTWAWLADRKNIEPQPVFRTPFRIVSFLQIAFLVAFVLSWGLVHCCSLNIGLWAPSHLNPASNINVGKSTCQRSRTP